MTTAEERFAGIVRKSNAPCSCGATHAISLRHFRLHAGALAELPDVIAELGKFAHVTMVCDEHTYQAAGKRVEGLLAVDPVILDPRGLHADEHGVALLEAKLSPATDLLLAVGSGTVHDITRYTAYTHGLSFVSVPTAASVDGFVSTVAAMTWHGAKKTLTAVGPAAMVADSEILASAPRALTAAGVGDMLGKFVALADWKIGTLLTGEPYCDEIVRLEEEALREVVLHAKDIARADVPAVETLMYGLVLSGLAMQLAGNSRPASGAEHHISHLIEMGVLNPPNGAYHGEKVGVATAMVCDFYRALSPKSPAFDPALAMQEEEIRRVFGDLADEILDENKKNCLADVTPERFAAKWGEISPVLASLPAGDEIRGMLRLCGGSATLSDLHLPEAMADGLFRYSPEVRARLTMMRLAGACRFC